MKNVFLLFIIAAFFLLNTTLLKANDTTFTVQKGVIDLSTFNFEKNGNIKLNGNWKFFHQKFLNFERIINNNNYCLVKVPKNLKGQTCEDDTLSFWSYGTYYLKIIINPKDINKVFLLSAEGIRSSSKIYVNGQLVGYGGEIATNEKNIKSELQIHLNEFTAQTDTLHLVIQISNFHMRKFGALYPIEFGLNESIRKDNRIIALLNMIAIGGFIMMLLYHFILFLTRRKEKLILYFALNALVFTVHSLSYSELYFDVFSSFSFEFQLGIRRIAGYLYSGFSALFLYHAFKQEFNKTILKIIVSLSVFCAATVIILPLRINSIFLNYLYYSSIPLMLYYVFVIIKAYKFKREGAGILLWGIGINAVFIINDVLYDNNIIQTMGHLTIFGFFFRSFSQAILIALRFNNAYKRSEKLLVEKNELKLENKEKDVLIQEIHHRVKNNLQSISSIIDMQIMSMEANVQKSVLTQTHVRIILMSLVHEMLYSQDDLSYINLKEYLKKLVFTIYRMVNTENIEIDFKLDTDEIDLTVSDCISLGMLTSEAISNSIKYAFENTEKPEICININYDRKSNIIFYSIKDNGKGLDETFNVKKEKSLGMQLIEIFATQLNAEMQIKSKNGTEIQLSYKPQNHES